MVRSILAIIFMSAFASWSQQGRLVAYPPPIKQGYRVPGLLSAASTFSPSAMLNRGQTNFYISGFAEYQMDNKISFRGDNYFFLNSSNENPFVDKAFRSYFGAFYHLNQSGYENWDVKIGFQPGVSYMKLADGEGSSEGWLSPSFSTSIGADFYVWKYFHFFTNLAYVNSSLRALPNGAERTDELIFSAGLGFQIKTRK